MILARSTVAKAGLVCLMLTTLATAAANNAFTPERLITAPRASTDVQLSPDNRHFAVGVSYPHYDGRPSDHAVYIQPVPKADAKDTSSRASPIALDGISYATWLDDEHLVYLNSSKLYVASHNLRQGAYELATLAAPIDGGSLKVGPTGKNDQRRLFFTAEVYEDGTLEGVSEVETKEHNEEWDRVKAYDGDNGALYRHWDIWNRPGKRSHIFTAVLSLKGGDKRWSIDGKGFHNLLKGSHFHTPIPPFNGNEDWDINEEAVIFNTKAIDLPEAWHTRTDVYYVPVDGGEAQKLSHSSDHGAISSPVFSPNGEYVAWLQMSIDGFESDKRVPQLYDIQSGEQKALLTEWDRSPSSVTFSKDGKQLYLVTEDHQKDKVYVVDIAKAQHTDEPQELISLKEGSVQAIVPIDEHRSLLASSSVRHPAEVYLYSHYNDAAYPLTWFTGAETSSLKDVDFGSKAPEMFSYPAPDRMGEKRWGWLHYPRGYDEGKNTKWPVVILIHGGPEGAWTDSWSTRWNPEVFAAAGYLVATMDPTGSTGFGQKYQEGILNNWGGEPYRDIMAGVHHVLKREAKHIDMDRVAAAGASYGGYMINWIQGHNDAGLFKALICHDGVFSTFSTFYSTEEHWFPEHEFGGSVPWNLTARSVYAKWSPEQHTSNWNTPQLIIHGDKDFRLTPDQGISAFNVLRRRGVDTRLVYFEHEGHWVQDPRSSLRWHREIFAWLHKYIGHKSAGGGEEESEVREGVARDVAVATAGHHQVVFNAA